MQWRGLLRVLLEPAKDPLRDSFGISIERVRALRIRLNEQLAGLRSRAGSLQDPAFAIQIGELQAEHDQLVEHGDAEPADSAPDSDVVSHDVHGPADVTAVLELFDRRYRDLRGDDEPYSSQDPA